MGVSFKISRTGNKYKPKGVLKPEVNSDDVPGISVQGKGSGSLDDSSLLKFEGNYVRGGEDFTGISNSSLPEHEVSFLLNLYAEGYSIEKPKEEVLHLTALHPPKLMHPYDRASETFFSAIESGRLPGDALDDIPCKFVDGAIICEIRDYRKCTFETSPAVCKVSLKISLEDVVKEVPLNLDGSWTYGDLMEVEAQIVKALQPRLCLDPRPRLDRLCGNPVLDKVTLGLSNMRRKRSRELQTTEVSVTTSRVTHGKKVCIDKFVDTHSNRPGDVGFALDNATGQQFLENSSLRSRSFTQDGSSVTLPLGSQQLGCLIGVNAARTMQDQESVGVSNVSSPFPTSHDMLVSYDENCNSVASLTGKRDYSEVHLTPFSALNKKIRPGEGIRQSQMGPPMNSIQASDMNWRNTIYQQPAASRGMQYSNLDSGQAAYGTGSTCMRFGTKEEQLEADKLNSELNQIKNDVGSFDQQHRLQQNLVRTNISQPSWNNNIQDSRKEELVQKKKSAQSPRVSTGAMAQSPLSSKSGEFSSSSGGAHYSAATTTSALGSQREKSIVISGHTSGAVPSHPPSVSDALQRQPPTSSSKRRSSSVPKTPGINAVGSPASVSTSNVPLNAGSPSVGTSAMSDQIILERFSKIEMVMKRKQLIPKRNKVENYPIRKPISHSPENLLRGFSNAENTDPRDDLNGKMLSKSLLGGSMNASKARIINATLADRILPGNVVSRVPRIMTRMTFSEKPNDGTVALHYGEIEDSDVPISEEDLSGLPSLPNTHMADLLADQFCSLIMREGFNVDDQLHLKQTLTGVASNQLTDSGVPTTENPPFGESVSSQQAPINEGKPIYNGNAAISAPQNYTANNRMMPPGNPQVSQVPQSLLSGLSMPLRSQFEPQSTIQQQSALVQPQQQSLTHNQNAFGLQSHPQFQRPPMVLSSNPLPHLNTLSQNPGMQLGGHMVNKTSLQLQLLQQQQQQQMLPQQQQQQQKQTQMQPRKMMMGLGTTMGMGNLPNNMVGLGGLNSPIGIGGVRGIGGSGISGPMSAIGLNSIGHSSQNSNIANALSQQLRSGQLTPQDAALLKFRMAAQNRSTMLGGPQAGMPGVRQVQPTSAGLNMLSQSLNRANMNPLQRSAMSTMGPPKPMAGMNMYGNQQQLQQQQLQLEQQQQLHQQLQQQHLQQLQEPTSSLQAVVASSQVGSPSTMMIPQLNPQSQQQQSLQHPSPQQLNQRTPVSPQMSSGAIHAISAGNPDVCPSSPQLSSQTHGSVGSITNSPMELQGVNKGNSLNNV